MCSIAGLAILVALVTSCVNVSSERGVEKRWGGKPSGVSNNQWTKGTTTKGEILKDLGPPSQVVSLGDETVFYYLRENMKGRGLILFFYNDVRVSAQYDRAIFFFDQNGKLSDMSISEAE